MKRNLIFHLYPRRGQIWKWHIERLMEYRSVWNGRRIVTVVLDKRTEDEATVAQAIAPLEAEVSFRQNDPELGETKFFIEALERVKSLDPDEATFYAHSKGVTKSSSPNDPIVRWARAMYVLNLGSIDAIEHALRRYGTVGCFRHQLKHGGAARCYAGTFFWLRHSQLFSREWSKIDRSFYGVEGYPGVHFRWKEMRALTPDNLGPLWLYSGGVTDERIEEWKSYWREDMHQSVIDFLKRVIVRNEVSNREILEVGSYNVNGTPRSVLEPFKPRSYLGVDYQGGPCVDKVVHVDNLVKEFGEDKFDMVVSTEMLEHVRSWMNAVVQMKGVTKVGGLLVITTRSPGFMYHPYPEDHWRFTMDHFKAIFADMEILNLENDVPTFPGVLLKARKKKAGTPLVDDLMKIVPAPPR